MKEPKLNEFGQITKDPEDDRFVYFVLSGVFAASEKMKIVDQGMN